MKSATLFFGISVLLLVQLFLDPEISFAQDSTRIFLTPQNTPSSVLLPPLPASQPVADTSGITDTSSVFMQDLIHFVRVGFGVALAPLTFDRYDWEKTGLSLAGTALLFLADKRVKNWALHNQNRTDDLLFYLDHYYGKGYSLFFTWGLYGYGALVNNEKIRKLGRNATEAFVFSGAIVGAIKLLVGRRRPYAGDNHLFFRPLQFAGNDYQAMPSAHASFSFAVSTVMAKSFNNIYWKIFWYGSATLVSASRIYHNQHWLSDVTMGAIIGYSVGSYVVGYDKQHGRHHLSHRIIPFYGMGTVGVRYYF